MGAGWGWGVYSPSKQTMTANHAIINNDNKTSKVEEDSTTALEILFGSTIYTTCESVSKHSSEDCLGLKP